MILLDIDLKRHYLFSGGKNIMSNKIKVTWFWASGRKDSLYVSRGMLGTIISALDRDNRIFGGQVNGTTYNQFVHTYGGYILHNLEVF